MGQRSAGGTCWFATHVANNPASRKNAHSQMIMVPLFTPASQCVALGMRSPGSEKMVEVGFARFVLRIRPACTAPWGKVFCRSGPVSGKPSCSAGMHTGRSGGRCRRDDTSPHTFSAEHSHEYSYSQAGAVWVESTRTLRLLH
jgi:hypothetical protein